MEKAHGKSKHFIKHACLHATKFWIAIHVNVANNSMDKNKKTKTVNTVKSDNKHIT